MHTRIEEIKNIGFKILFTPIILGDHHINAKFSDQLIPGSPLTMNVFDSSKVTISDIEYARLGEEFSFVVDPSNAGKGNLEWTVTADGKPVLNEYRKENKCFIVTFTPERLVNHIISVKFNGNFIPGCPVTCPVTDTSLVTAHGEGLKTAAVQKTASFVVRFTKLNKYI